MKHALGVLLAAVCLLAARVKRQYATMPNLGSVTLTCPPSTVILSCACDWADPVKVGLHDHCARITPNVVDNSCTAWSNRSNSGARFYITCAAGLSQSTVLYSAVSISADDSEVHATCPYGYSMSGCIASSSGDQTPDGALVDDCGSCVAFCSARQKTYGEYAIAHALCINTSLTLESSRSLTPGLNAMNGPPGIYIWNTTCDNGVVTDCMCHDVWIECQGTRVVDNTCSAMTVPDHDVCRTTQVVTGICMSFPTLPCENNTDFDPPFPLQRPVNCRFPLSHRGVCSLTCAAGYFATTQLELKCDDGEIIYPTNNSCQTAAFVKDSTVAFTLEFNLTLICGGTLDDNAQTLDTIMKAFVDHVVEILHVDPADISIEAPPVRVAEGFNASLKFKSTATTAATQYSSDFLSMISGGSVFNISSGNSVCEVGVSFNNIYITFTSFYYFLKGLAFWVLFLTIGVLIAAVIFFLWINRKSHHPFALLGAVISVLNLGAKIVFLQFLYTTYYGLQSQDSRLTIEFLFVAFLIGTSILSASFVLNLVAAAILLRIHARKNPAGFDVWLAKHRLALAVAFLLCGLNPGSMLVLCSGSFGLDVFEAPISHQAQTQFQGAGLVSVMLTDVPLIILQCLTLYNINSDPHKLNWSGGDSSVLIPLVFGVVSVVLSIVRRLCVVCLPRAFLEATSKGETMKGDTMKGDTMTLPE